MSGWDLWIIVATLGGIASLVWLVLANSRHGDSKPGETTGHVWDNDLTELNNPLPSWWRTLYIGSAVFGVVYLILYPGFGHQKMWLGWTQVKQYEREMRRADEQYGFIFDQYAKVSIEELAKDPVAVQKGERLFSAYCTICHGSDAAGVKGFPNLTDSDWLWGGTPEAIEHSILKGRTGAMPAWGTLLGETGVADVTQYVRQLAGLQHDAQAAERGVPMYTQTCVACHGQDGTGNPALGSPNLTDDVWLYGSEPADIAISISNGRSGVMPPHENLLGAGKVHLLAAYVYGLSKR